MLKKVLLVSIITACAFAGQYATLKDGKTIILHENGTWEEVTVVRSGSEQMGVMAAKDLAGTPKAIDVKVEPVARMLVGKWSSKDGSVAYDFRDDGKVTYTLNGETKTDGYTIQFIDSNDNTLSVSIGDSSRYGKVVFGGLLRKLKISADGMSAVDYSDEITKLKTVEIKKIGQASASSTNTPIAPITVESNSATPVKGFAK
jgi:hypothetical protein